MMQEKLALIDRMERIYQEHADQLIAWRHIPGDQRRVADLLLYSKMRDVLDDLKAEVLIEDAHTTQSMHDFFAIHEDARLEHSA